MEEPDLPDPKESEEVSLEEVGIGDLPAFFRGYEEHGNS